jgi:hypothetical protein
MVASLDRFIKKRVIKNILFMKKRSRLAEEKSPVRLSIQNGGQMRSKVGLKNCPRDGHSNAGSYGFRWGTVFLMLLNYVSKYLLHWPLVPPPPKKKNMD